MGIIRLTLITAGLLWLAMYYFGRDEGLPEDRIGRDPEPDAAITVAEEPAAEPAPATAPIAPTAPDTAVVTPPAEPAPEPAPAETMDALETAVSEANAVDAAETPDEPDLPAPAVAAPAADTTAPEAAAAPQPEPAPLAEPEPVLPVLYVSGRRVNVRSGPSTDYAAITSLARGAAVVDLGEVGDGWHEIRLDTGEIGYMSGDWLSPDPQ
jgi:hypothetical protein